MSNDNEKISNALQNIRNGTITSLDLSSRNIGPVGATALAGALESNSTITCLDLSYNNIGDEGATALANALKNNSSIRSLNLSFNQIGPKGAIALAKALKNNSSIRSLDLSDNYIEDEGAIVLAKALEVNSSITELNLSCNEIGDEGAAGLAKALKVNSTITKIDLENNKIGDKGATALAEALKKNSSLRSFNLSENYIKEDGGEKLGQALKVNNTLRYLNLCENNIKDKGAFAFADALRINNTLNYLNLYNNNIDYDELLGLVEALKVNSTITYFNPNVNLKSLSGCFIDTEQVINENKAIYELSHIFLEQIKSNFEKEMKERMKERLPDELILYIENYFPKVDYDHDQYLIRISEENREKQIQKLPNQYKLIKRKILQQKKKVVNKIFQSFKEYLELKLEFWQFWQVYDIEKTKELLIPRKLLLQFLQDGDDMFFTFKNRDLQSAVIEKLERIVSLEYSNVIEELKERTEKQKIDENNPKKQQKQKMEVQKTSTSSSNKQSQIELGKTKEHSYQHYEKLLFDTYNNQILKRFVEINNKKVENLKKQLQSKKTQKIQTQKQKQKQTQIQTQIQIQIQIQKLTEQNQRIRRNQRISKTQQNKLTENNNKIKLLGEIKNLFKINETVSKMNKIEELILFYMLPDTVIYKYFDESMFKQKNNKRKISQVDQSTQQQRSSSKKVKSNYLTYTIISSNSHGDITIKVVDESGNSKTEYLKNSEKDKRIQQLQNKGYT